MERIKENKLSIISSSIITLLPMIVGLLMWNELPDQIATHFDIHGNPDQYSGKGLAICGIPMIMLLMQIITMSILSSLSKEKLPDIVYHCMSWIMPFCSLLCGYMILGSVFSLNIDIAFASTLFLGFTFVIMGNYMPKIRPNKFAGVRIKWTLESSQNWAHTHRIAGYFMCICGIVMIIMSLMKCFLDLNSVVMLTGLGIVFIIAIAAPMLSSYMYYKKHGSESGYYDHE